MKCGKDCAAYLLGIVVVAVVKNDLFNNNLFLTVQQHLWFIQYDLKNWYCFRKLLVNIKQANFGREKRAAMF